MELDVGLVMNMHGQCAPQDLTEKAYSLPVIRCLSPRSGSLFAHLRSQGTPRLMTSAVAFNALAVPS